MEKNEGIILNDVTSASLQTESSLTFYLWKEYNERMDYDLCHMAATKEKSYIRMKGKEVEII